TWAAYAYLVVDNDMRGAGDPGHLLRATAAHEFHHAIQFGYDINDALNWYYEATSSWLETVTFPNQQDATPYVGDLYSTLSYCIGTNSANDLRIYGEWLLIDNIARDYGNDAVVRLWEHIADVEGMEALYNFLSEVGTTPQDFM